MEGEELDAAIQTAINLIADGMNAKYAMIEAKLPYKCRDPKYRYIQREAGM